MTTEKPNSETLDRAYGVADALAQYEGTQYPDDFLADLQKTDPVLLKEFAQLTDLGVENEDTIFLLGQLDGALKDYEARIVENADAEKIAPVTELRREIDAIGLTDEHIESLVQMLIKPNATAPAWWGNPFDGTNSSLPDSFTQDRMLAGWIGRNYPTSKQLMAAYEEALRSGDPKNIARFTDPTRFLLEKGKVYMDHLAKEAEAKKTEAVRQGRTLAIEKDFEQNQDVPIATILENAEKAILERDADGVFDPKHTWAMIQEYRAYINDPSLDRATEEYNARYFCSELFVAEQERRGVKASQAKTAEAPVDDQAAEAPEHSEEPLSEPTGNTSTFTPPATPEAPVDYRADAREHPEKYLTEAEGDTSIFTPPNDEANRGIRIEDLYENSPTKPNLTSSRYPGMEFAYKDGSWYDVAGSGRRLAILRGDKLSEVEEKTPALVATNEAPREEPEVVAPTETAPDDATLRIKAEELAQIHAKYTALVAHDAELAREAAAARNAATGKRSFLETPRSQAKDVTEAEATYATALAELELQKKALAADYETLMPALASIDPTLFEGREEYADTLAYAEQLARYKDSTAERIAQLDPSLVKPADAVPTEETDSAITDANDVEAPVEGSDSEA